MKFYQYINRDCLSEQKVPEIKNFLSDSLLKKKPKENKIKTEAKFFRGEAGNKNHITAVIETNVPTEELSELKGAYDENRMWKYKHTQWFFGNWSEEKFKEIAEDIIKNGIKEKIFLTVDYNDLKPKVSEGNHRIAIARVLDIKTIPCEIRFFGKAEDTVKGYWKKMVQKLKKEN